MEAIFLYILLALVVVLVIIRRPLKRMLSRKAADKGREMGARLGEKTGQKVTNSAIEKLSTGLVMPLTAEENLRQILASAKKVRPINDSSWHLAFAKPDDITLRWEAGMEHGALRIAETIEMMETPMGDRQWLKLLADTESALSAVGIETSRQQFELSRQARAGEPDAIWVAV